MSWASKKTFASGRVRWRGGYRDAGGREHSTSYRDTKREALRDAREAETAVRRGTWVSPDAGKITFSEYFETRWFPGRVREVNTRRTYMSNYRTALKPYWGSWALKDIRHSDVQAWINKQVEEGHASADTIHKRYLLLALVLDAGKGPSAVRDRLIEQSPCGPEIIEPTRVLPPVQVYSPDQMDALIAEMDPWWADQTRFQFDMGLRWGELMGASVDALSNGNQRLRVRRTIIQPGDVSMTGNGTKYAWKDYTKTGDQRLVAVPLHLRGLLERLISDRNLGPTDRLFSPPAVGGLPVRTSVWTEGEPVDRNLYRRLVWRPALETAGLPYLKPAVTRGSHISMLLAAGVDIPTVMERVGHRNYTTTRRYTDISAGAEQRIFDVFEQRGSLSSLDRTAITPEMLEEALARVLRGMAEE